MTGFFYGQLMWLAQAGEWAADGAQESKPRRALEDEPLLAARIVVEDCLCLLLDVDDIDRLPLGAGDEAALRTRRALLMEVYSGFRGIGCRTLAARARCPWMRTC